MYRLREMHASLGGGGGILAEVGVEERLLAKRG